MIHMPPCAGVLDEKAAATQALGLYAKNTLAGFAPFIEPVLAVLLRMAAYFHDDVREQAYEALSFLVLATDKAFPSPTPGEKRDPLPFTVCDRCVIMYTIRAFFKSFLPHIAVSQRRKLSCHSRHAAARYTYAGRVSV